MCLSAPKVSAPPPTPKPEDAFSASLRETQKRAGMKGFASTISAGLLPGATYTNPTPAKSLLGGG